MSDPAAAAAAHARIVGVCQALGAAPWSRRASSSAELADFLAGIGCDRGAGLPLRAAAGAGGLPTPARAALAAGRANRHARRSRGGVRPPVASDARERTVSLAVRVIPCLDVDAGRVVKGVNFVDLRDAGDPVEMATVYDAEGADELVFLDITASPAAARRRYDVVRRTAEQVFIPLTVGGGVRTADDVDRLLRAGADKVGINTAAIARPEVIARDRRRGSATRCWCSPSTPGAAAEQPSGFEVTTHGGRRRPASTRWSGRAARGELGAGEILLNSMDADGTKDGFDLEMIRAVRARVQVPLIASGGAGASSTSRRPSSRCRRRARRERVPLRRADHRRRSSRRCEQPATRSGDRGESRGQR